MTSSGSFFRCSVAILACVLVTATGCGGGPKGPAAVDPQLSAASLDAAFTNAPANVRGIVQEASKALRENDQVSGFITLYGVTQNMQLTPEQQRAAGDALVGSLKALAEAAKKGDERADKALAAYRSRK